MKHPITTWTHICGPTGKRCYPSKKLAKAAARFFSGTNAYQCDPDPAAEPHWHFGHLPKPVIAGELTRDDIRRRW